MKLKMNRRVKVTRARLVRRNVWLVVKNDAPHSSFPVCGAYLTPREAERLAFQLIRKARQARKQK